MKKLKIVLEQVVKAGYSIDKQGVVRNPKGKVLSGSLYDGYLKIGVRTKFNSSYALRIHKLQAYIKFGDEIFEEGIVIRHLNNNSQDNSWDNIDIGTQSENMMDKSGWQRKAQAGKRRVITEEIKQSILKDKINGFSNRKLSAKYGIPKSTIRDYLKKK